MNFTKRYRKKPVVIEAVQLTKENVHLISEWCGGVIIEADEYVALDIPTLEGVMRADAFDYIIRGIKGEFYPCKPDVFNATYEREES